MNLTYETTETGYTIFNNGVPWIVQDSYIPYPAATMAESAQLHINDLIASQNAQPTVPTTSIEEALGNLLFDSAADKARITDIEKSQGEMLMEIETLKMGGSL